MREHQNSPRSSVRQLHIGSLITLFGITLAVGAVLPAWAMWPQGGIDMPVSRLLKTLGAYVKQHPTDAEGYYLLARVQSAALALTVKSFNVYKDDPLPRLSHDWPPIAAPTHSSQTLSHRDLQLMIGSLHNYKTATELEPKRGLAWFGPGFESEQSLRFPQSIVPIARSLGLQQPGPVNNTVLNDTIRKLSIDAYRKAIPLRFGDDMNPRLGAEDVSAEAAAGILRLQQNQQLSSVEEAEITSLKAKLKELASVTLYVTPILIDLQRVGNLSDLLTSNNHVKFDLSGENPNQLWPWVKPTTGILVWDPHHSGKITSGLQLFGSVTWWLFWEDGYGPLAALDNDHNGWLEGKELDGIAVWFDRNGNGVSDPGEVVSLKSLGIKRIAVSAAGRSGGVPFNRHGVQFADGSFAATYDWTPRAVK